MSDDGRDEANSIEYIPDVLDRREEFTGKFLRLVVDRLHFPSGIKKTREIVLHAGVVGILPVLADGRILLVRQYRHPVGRFLWEIPAGLIDPGEDPLVSAKRELREETGYTARQWRRVISFFSSPGFTDEAVTIYQAGELLKESFPDPREIDVCRSFSASELMYMITEGEICDAKTILAILPQITAG